MKLYIAARVFEFLNSIGVVLIRFILDLVAHMKSGIELAPKAPPSAP